jgi:hypothetical protein
MRKILLPALVLMLSAGCQITLGDWGDDCTHTAERSARLDAAGATRVDIEAGAGSLTIRGREGAGELVAEGTACAAGEGTLEEIRLTAERRGDVLFVATEFPNGIRGPARLDLEIDLPANLPIYVDDGSGPVVVQGVAALEIEDGSGSLHVSDVAGDLTVDDGSGEIEIERVGGQVRLRDGSGEIHVLAAGGDVIVEEDGSGEIEIRGVDGSVIIEEDGSGSIAVRDVRGDFELLRDGSGAVDVDVDGSVRMPR